MAYADYFHCSICDVKCFYDADLNWDNDPEKEIRGMPGTSLDNCADIKALCFECAKTHKVVIEQLPEVSDE